MVVLRHLAGEKNKAKQSQFVMTEFRIQETEDVRRRSVFHPVSIGFSSLPSIIRPLFLVTAY